MMASVSGIRSRRVVPLPTRESISTLPPISLHVGPDHVHPHPASADIGHRGSRGLDFRLPPSEPKVIRDASAAAVAVCGFQELLKYSPDDGPIAAAVRSILSRLLPGADCLTNTRPVPACCGTARWAMVRGRAQNAYTSWGDYYLMEALDRELHGGATGLNGGASRRNCNRGNTGFCSPRPGYIYRTDVVILCWNDICIR